MGRRCMVESRVATAGILMHKNPLGRDKRARERGTHRRQEQVEILKDVAALIAARTTRGRPGRASLAVQQCMTQFGLYGEIKMIQQQVNRVANLPEWTTVLEVMIRVEISANRSSISNDEARTVELTSAGLTVAPGFPGRASRH